MYTSLLVAALTGLSPVADAEGAPSWKTDYQTAREEAASAKKPLAVFMSSGDSGWEQLGQAEGFGDEGNRMLAAEYICVYLNTSTVEGKRLAKAFAMPGGVGIVISDRTGELQAFRHEGDLSNPTLLRYLKRYADPNRVATTTEKNLEK